MPPGWFPESGSTTGTADSPHPILDAILAGFGALWAFAYSLITYAGAQMRIRSSTDGWLELAALDYYGAGQFPRATAEPDPSYAARIQSNLLPDGSTREAISAAITKLTGQVPIISECWRPSDTGVYDGVPGRQIASILHVQTSANLVWTTSGNSATSSTFPAIGTDDSIVCILYMTSNVVISSITDNAGNSYLIGGTNTAWSTFGVWGNYFIGIKLSGNPTSFTINFATTPPVMNAGFEEFSGVDTFDMSSGALQQQMVLNPGNTVTLGHANDCGVALMFADNGATPTQPVGYTIGFNHASSSGLMIAYDLNVGASGSYSYAWSVSDSNPDLIAFVALTPSATAGNVGTLAGAMYFSETSVWLPGRVGGLSHANAYQCFIDTITPPTNTTFGNTVIGYIDKQAYYDVPASNTYFFDTPPSLAGQQAVLDVINRLKAEGTVVWVRFNAR